MEALDIEGAKVYQKALSEMNYEALREWVCYLRKKLDESCTR